MFPRDLLIRGWEATPLESVFLSSEHRLKDREKKKKKKKKVLSERVRSRRAEGLIPSAARSRKMAESEAGDKGGG